MTKNESARRSVRPVVSIRSNPAHAHRRSCLGVKPGPCFCCGSVTVTFIAGFWLCQDCAELVTTGNDDAHTIAHTSFSTGKTAGQQGVRATRLDYLSRGFGQLAVAA